MESNQVILWMIISCIGFVGAIVFIKPLRKIVKIALSSCIGFFVLIFFNFILTPFSLSLGINWVNALIFGFLGIPGVISLYIIQYFL